MEAEIKKPKYLDPKDFYANELDSWESLWDIEASLYENTLNLVSKSVFLPEPNLLNPLVSIYMLLPTKWIRIAGIMLSYGDQGSGKSTIASLANFMHGFKTTFSPADTFASVRNALDGMRWIDPIDKTMEKEGGLLCWDNISIETLKREPKIYQLLLYGYNRLTDKTSIAGVNGVNKDYYVFCPKIVSSIEPIHLYHSFQELRRRLIVVPHKPWEKFLPEERKHYKGIDLANDKIDLDSVSWGGIEKKYYQFWNNEDVCKHFVEWRALLTKRGKKGFKVPESINSSRWTIIVDLIAAGLTLGVWNDIQFAVDYFEKYWKYSDLYIYGEFSATLEHLRIFIQEEVGILRELNDQLAKNGVKTQPVVISAKKLKDKIAALQSQGCLDITPGTKEIQTLMWELGFKLTTKGWIEK